MATIGTFILADISGYTPFLAGVGIEHGKEITTHLFNTMLRANQKRWRVANVQGDCIFFYCEGARPVGEVFEHAQAMHEAFCREAGEIAARASCPCGACTRTNQLALKFIVHSGQYDVQRIAGRDELIGSDVVVAHRLLKNSVPLDEYILLSAATYPGDLQVGLLEAEGRDEYEDIGGVDYLYFDLATSRKEVAERNMFFIGPDEAMIRIELDIDAAPDLVWETLRDDESLRHWMRLRESSDVPGRQGHVGTVHRCVAEGGETTIHVTTAFDEHARRQTVKLYGPKVIKDCFYTTTVDEREGGMSRFSFYMIYRPGIPVISQLMDPLMRRVAAAEMRKNFERLKVMCEARVADPSRH